jgi:hypothetical protein
VPGRGILAPVSHADRPSRCRISFRSKRTQYEKNGLTRGQRSRPVTSKCFSRIAIARGESIGNHPDVTAAVTISRLSQTMLTGFICSSFEELEVSIADVGGEGEFGVDLGGDPAGVSQHSLDLFQAESFGAQDGGEVWRAVCGPPFFVTPAASIASSYQRCRVRTLTPSKMGPARRSPAKSLICWYRLPLRGTYRSRPRLPSCSQRKGADIRDIGVPPECLAVWRTLFCAGIPRRIAQSKTSCWRRQQKEACGN